MVRESVCARLGAAEGRVALAALYPDGAKTAVERLREEGRSDAIDVVAKDTLERWAARKATAAAVARP